MPVSFLLCQMQGKRKGAAGPQFTLSPHVFAQKLHDFIGNGQSKTGAMSMMRLDCLIETLKDMGEVFLRNPNTGILHRNEYGLFPEYGG